MAEGHAVLVERKKRSGESNAKQALREIAFRRFADNDSLPALVDAEIGLYVGSIGACQNDSALRSLGITHILSLCDIDPPNPSLFQYLSIRDLTDKPRSDLLRILPQALEFIRFGVKVRSAESSQAAAAAAAAIAALDQQEIATQDLEVLSLSDDVRHPGENETNVVGGGDLCEKYDAASNRLVPRRGGGGVLVHCMQGKSRSVSVVAAFLMETYEIGMLEALERIRRVRPQAVPNPGFAVQLRKFEKSLRAPRNTTACK